MAKETKQYIMYKGKPFVREKNAVCYGDMNDKYYLFMLILSTKKITSADGNVQDIPDRVLVQVLSNDNSKSPAEKIEKQFERNGLYDAMDIGLFWLNKLNA